MIIAYISMYVNNYKTSFYLSITLTIVVHDFYEFIIILDFGNEFIELLKINNNNFKWILLLDYMEGKYTEWPNPQIRGENRQSCLTD